MKFYNYEGEITLAVYADFTIDKEKPYYVRLITLGNNHGICLKENFESNKKAEEYIKCVAKILNLTEIDE